jgi:hypothetical protein
VRDGKLPAEKLAGPDLEPEDSDIYDGYLELDRSESGALRTGSMFEVLEKGLAIHDRHQQLQVRQLWRLMRAEESKYLDMRRKAKKKATDEAGGRRRRGNQEDEE